MPGKKQPALFEDRFIESFVGSSIYSDQRTAIIELIANAWDAGATEVQVSWPKNIGDVLSVRDNGHGMTEIQFMKRFRTLAYDRIKEQTGFAEIPADHAQLIGKRPAFGRNGKGRLGSFAFGDPFFVTTSRDGFRNQFQINKDQTTVLAFQKVGESEVTDFHGTEISVTCQSRISLSEDDARKEIGMRFLTDPHFEVSLNGQKITFADIPEDHMDVIDAEVPGIGTFSIRVIDIQAADKNTQQHGIAWHVKNRMVGECTWKGSGSEHLIDGRSSAAKRYIFIVNADLLEQAVTPDWNSFYPTDPAYKKSLSGIHKAIRQHLLSLTKGQREDAFAEIENAARPQLKKLGLVKREKWENFIKSVQEECPSIAQDDLQRLSILLATLESSESKYGLIELLAASTAGQLDDLHGLLQRWDVDFAKIVLDEIEYRTTLLERLQSKVLSRATDEVQELQPLFHRGLWIFGPEYETIQFTSNKGMTAVVQSLFKDQQGSGSRDRPDFAILPDSTVGLYSLPKFSDDDGAEIGISRLTIIELKKPEIPIGAEQKNQAWKYVWRF
ncbi:hypothetical protein CKK33_01695 [Mucilaginibacter sp. MD40]|uniref:ATP-binding protein n=1 Tax=Mucilaginibacter sp. MD40 TaxID=2029590 RepID=UPI000BACD10E|nr:ATP-binding protein [Mucilaginibacter sp. MD40]PAW92271.1 hypothetical protein CKK33_01695 [Mucilaginibacter sp. MD40]